MFNFKEFEFCNIYYNPYEDIEIIQGTVDQFLKKIGVSFEVGN